MEKTNNVEEMFGYDKPFRYSAEWYAGVYHYTPSDDDMVDPGPGQYLARDRSCLEGMGVRDGDSVLVPGCGGGHNISLLRSAYKGIKIVGFDWSETVLGFCRRVFPDVLFIQSSVGEFNPAMVFDHVVAFDFTEHLSLTDYAKFIDLSFRSLRVGGTVGIVPGKTIRPEHINLMHPCTIANHLSQFGFKITAMGQQWVVGEKP